MEENDEIYLGLGLGLYTPKRDELQKNKKRLFFLDLSIPSDHSNDDRSSQGKEEDFTNFSENCSRKKLRLTRDQSMLLEDSFKQHSTLNTVQKQALAEKLKLKPRQVEVWFQNRRARTKLKQTEVECQFLKKNCERLNEENMRLKRELLELRNNSLSLNNNKTNKSPFFYKTPALMQKCQSCHHKIDDHETTS